jgi:hypothetical protein
MTPQSATESQIVNCRKADEVFAEDGGYVVEKVLKGGSSADSIAWTVLHFKLEAKAHPAWGSTPHGPAHRNLHPESREWLRD